MFSQFVAGEFKYFLYVSTGRRFLKAFVWFPLVLTDVPSFPLMILFDYFAVINHSYEYLKKNKRSEACKIILKIYETRNVRCVDVHIFMRNEISTNEISIMNSENNG